MFWPSKESAAKMGVKDALKLYYGVSLVPLLLFIVLGSICLNLGLVSNRFGAVPLVLSLLPGVGLNVLLVAFAFAYFWVLIPVSLLIDAALYHLVGKNFLKLFKGGYERTFTALVFGFMPMLLLYWLFVIPGVNALALIVLPVWGFVVDVIALSVQQKVTRLQAFAVIAVLLGLVALVMLLSASALAAFGAPLFSSWMV